MCDHLKKRRQVSHHCFIRPKKTDRQTDWKEGREAGKQADGLTERLRDRRIDRQIGKDAETEMAQAHKSVVIT